MRTKVICLALLLCLSVGLLSACSGGSIVGKYKDDGGYYTLILKDDNTATLKDINWTYEGPYTFENGVVRLRYNGGYGYKTHFDFVQEGRNFRLSFPDCSFLLKRK